MPLFGKSSNCGFMDIIRCDEPSYLIWKWHPEGSKVGKNKRENAIRYGSRLVVKEGEAAIFVYNQNNGDMMEFIKGPYDKLIETNNFPVLASIVGLAYHGQSPFQAEVYFINLEKVIQIPFAVPYFDLYDGKFTNFGVPTAVRGKITFNISDYQKFVKLRRLIDFDMNEFQTQIRDAIAMYVKTIVANVPLEKDIPVIQIERAIGPITEMIEKNIRERFERDFAVNITAVDISAIELDKSSEGYYQLLSVTRDVCKAKIQAETEDYIERLRIQREEEQYARHKQTQTANIGAVQLETQATVGKAGAEAIGHINNSETDGVKSESGVAYINPVSIMTEMAIGSAVGNNIASAISGVISENRTSSTATPPPIPKISYYVAADGKPTGPYDVEYLTKMASAGIFTKENMVWKTGMSDWEKAGKISELNTVFINMMPPIPHDV